MNFLIGTIKSWNIDNFNRYKKDNWYLATNDEELERLAKEVNPRIIFIVHWNRTIKPNIYNNIETIIFHATDLPKGKGKEPFQYLIETGYESTVLTVFRCTEGIDSGPIYDKIPLSLSGSAEECYKRCSDIIFKKIKEMINHTNKGGCYAPIIQVGESSECDHPTNEILLDATDNLEEIYNKIRAWDASSYPKAYFDVEEFGFELSNAVMRHGCIEAQVKIKIN